MSPVARQTDVARPQPPVSPPEPMVPVPYRLKRRRQELKDTVTLELAPAEGGPRLAYQPGQFTMIYAFGVGEIPISVSGDPANRKRLVQTIRAVGKVSRALTELRRGATVGVRGPFGTPWPIAESKGCDVVIVAGGLGLAPVRPVIYEVLRHRRDYGTVGICYGTRTHLDLLYVKELQAWRSRFDLQVYVTVDRADASWRGHVGVVTQLLPKLDIDPLETAAFVCGPEIMMRFTAAQLCDMGTNPGRIYLSMERNMKCAVGFCGHCQYGPRFICRDGPVLSYEALKPFLSKREL